MDEILRILREIVEVQQRIYDRYAALKINAPGATSDAEVDAQYLDLLRARLELAEYEAKAS